MRNEEAPQECRFFLVEAHKCLTSIAVLTEHGKTSLLYTFQGSMQANRDINLCDKHQWTFLLYETSVGFNSRNNFANFGSFAKVSVSLQFIIP